MDSASMISICISNVWISTPGWSDTRKQVTNLLRSEGVILLTIKHNPFNPAIDDWGCFQFRNKDVREVRHSPDRSEKAARERTRLLENGSY